MNNKKNKQNKYKKLSCPNCKSNNIIKWCKRKTKERGKLQRYFCKDCQNTFVNDDGFKRMRNHEKKITLCLDLFYRGLSTRKIQEHLSTFYPHNSDHSTILRWIRKYSLMIAKFTDKLKLDVGQETQVDEMQYKTKGKESWFIDSIDTKTRYMITSKYVKSRDMQEIKRLLKNIQKKTEDKVKTITTDGHKIYEKVVKKSFGYNNKLGSYNINHNVVNASQGEGFNIMIERLHNTIRERTKTFREFNQLESARAIMKGFEIYYNFIRRHQALGKCPYELATDLQLKTNNKWLELIKLATESI